MEKNIIGVFGLICSGKSSFSKMLANEMNALYIDADSLGHDALIYNKDLLVKEFTSIILNENSSIDRKKLGSIVFNNYKKLRKLEEINYPYIESRVEELIKLNDINIVIEAALIMRSNIRFMCNSLIYVNSKTCDIINRMKKNRNITEHEARKRLKMQRDVKNNRYNADILINNMKDFNNLKIIAKNLGRHYGFKSKYKRRKRIL